MACLLTFVVREQDRRNQTCDVFAAVSPNGQHIITGGVSLKRWSAADGSEVCTAITADNVMCVAYSPRGTQVAAGLRNHTIEIWPATLAAAGPMTLRGHASWVTSVAFSARGARMASAAGDDPVRLWDTRTGACMHVLRGHDAWVWTLAISSAGDMVACGNADGYLLLWDAVTGTLHDRRDLADHVNAVAFSPDDRYIVAAFGHHLCLIDTATGTIRAITPPQANGLSTIEALAVSGDGQRVVTSFNTSRVAVSRVDGTHLYDLPLRTASGPVHSLSLSASGLRLATVASDTTVQLWDLTRGSHQACIYVLVLAQRQRRLPHMPQYLWVTIMDEFV